MNPKDLGSELDKLIASHGEEAVLEQLLNWFGTTSFSTPDTDADVEDIADAIRYAFFKEEEEEEDDDDE